MLRHGAIVAVAMLLATPALAQTTTAPADTGGVPLQPLPAPMLGENAPPQAFIQAALHALAADRTGEAEEAIERAESRALTRSVRPSRADTPSQQPLVEQLTQAREALAAGNRMQAVTLLEAASKNKDAGPQ